MTCCPGPCAAAAHFDPKMAERDLRRYQRHGPDATTRILLAELRRRPLEGFHLLDVGAGIGVIAAELAGAGLASVTLADASPSSLEVARRHVAPRYASRPVQFILGDFTVTAWSAVTRMRRRCSAEQPRGRAKLSLSPILAINGTSVSPLCWRTCGFA